MNITQVVSFIIKTSFQRLVKLGFFLICVTVTLSIIESFALPTPLSPEQLYQQSDIIAKVKVLSVIKVQDRIKETENKYNTEKYHAWLKVLQVTKGKIQNNHTMIVTWNRVNRQLIGGWEVNYYPNEELITHLIWDDQEKTYKTLSWNATKIIKSSKNTLPMDIGQVYFASD